MGKEELPKITKGIPQPDLELPPMFYTTKPSSKRNLLLFDKSSLIHLFSWSCPSQSWERKPWLPSESALPATNSGLNAINKIKMSELVGFPFIGGNWGRTPAAHDRGPKRSGKQEKGSWPGTRDRGRHQAEDPRRRQANQGTRVNGGSDNEARQQQRQTKHGQGRQSQQTPQRRHRRSGKQERQARTQIRGTQSAEDSNECEPSGLFREVIPSADDDNCFVIISGFNPSISVSCCYFLICPFFVDNPPHFLRWWSYIFLLMTSLFIHCNDLLFAGMHNRVIKSLSG